MENRYLLVKRTPRGSLVSIERASEGKCLIKITNPKDMVDISNLLNYAGIEWRMFKKEAPTYKPMRLRVKPDEHWYVEFSFSDLAPVREVIETKLLGEPRG